MTKTKTMHEVYGEPNDEKGKHKCCTKCGYCIDCKDCLCKSSSGNSDTKSKSSDETFGKMGIKTENPDILPIPMGVKISFVRECINCKYVRKQTAEEIFKELEDFVSKGLTLTHLEINKLKKRYLGGSK